MLISAAIYVNDARDFVEHGIPEMENTFVPSKHRSNEILPVMSLTKTQDLALECGRNWSSIIPIAHQCLSSENLDCMT